MKSKYLFTFIFSPEYLKLISSGFESPSYITDIFENKPTKIETPKAVSHLWQPSDPKQKNLWQNVEFVRLINIYYKRIVIIIDLWTHPDTLLLLISQSTMEIR